MPLSLHEDELLQSGKITNATEFYNYFKNRFPPNLQQPQPQPPAQQQQQQQQQLNVETDALRPHSSLLPMANNPQHQRHYQHHMHPNNSSNPKSCSTSSSSTSSASSFSTNSYGGKSHKRNRKSKVDSSTGAASALNNDSRSSLASYFMHNAQAPFNSFQQPQQQQQLMQHQQPRHLESKSAAIKKSKFRKSFSSYTSLASYCDENTSSPQQQAPPQLNSVNEDLSLYSLANFADYQSSLASQAPLSAKPKSQQQQQQQQQYRTLRQSSSKAAKQHHQRHQQLTADSMSSSSVFDDYLIPVSDTTSQQAANFPVIASASTVTSTAGNSYWEKYKLKKNAKCESLNVANLAAYLKDQLVFDSKAEYERRKEEAIGRIILNERIKQIRTRMHEAELLKEYQFDQSVSTNDDDGGDGDDDDDENTNNNNNNNSTSYCNEEDDDPYDGECGRNAGGGGGGGGGDYYYDEFIPFEETIVCDDGGLDGDDVGGGKLDDYYYSLHMDDDYESGIEEDKYAGKSQQLTGGGEYTQSKAKAKNKKKSNAATKQQQQQHQQQQQQSQSCVKPGHELYQIGTGCLSMYSSQSRFNLKISMIGEEVKHIVNVLKQVNRTKKRSRTKKENNKIWQIVSIPIAFANV